MMDDKTGEWIGKRQTVEAVISAEIANRMQAMLSRDPIFKNGDDLPPAWHWLYFHQIMRADKLGAEGHATLGQFMPPVSFGADQPPRRMWAGGSLRFERPIYIGDQATKQSTVKSITQKEGRSGKLVFVIVEHAVSVDGVRRLLEEQTIVYREPVQQTGAGGHSRPSKPAVDGVFTADYTPDPILLFHYSALTHNSHRIHYDVDFCREQEGYPNLVVHGPLTATLLLDLFVHQFPEKQIARFDYRGRSPLFLPHSFRVHGNVGGEAWATNHEGGIAMSAEVIY